MGSWCCTASARQRRGCCHWLVGWETGSWARSTSSRWCRRTGSCRSDWTTRTIPGSRENQPGATMYQRSMPVAAGAKVTEAAYHSHTAGAGRRGGCNRVRRKVPGCALVISMADQASRFAGSGPERTGVEEIRRRGGRGSGRRGLRVRPAAASKKQQLRVVGWEGRIQTVEASVTKYHPRNRFAEETMLPLRREGNGKRVRELFLGFACEILKGAL
jgi:hypothetical protein